MHADKRIHNSLPLPTQIINSSTNREDSKSLS